MEEKNFPRRKHPRLKDFDYDIPGAYFVTVCAQGRKTIFSRVGRGLAPADEPKINLTSFGKIVEEELLFLNRRFPCIAIDQYVIMPNHIHAILLYDENAAGASPRPTLMDVVCAFKSLATKRCKEISPIEKVFQTSFFEHIIRDGEDYKNHVRYIFENPFKWREDELYTES